MMQFSRDSKVAEQQMHAIIFYLTAFGYIDGDFDISEKVYIQQYIGKLVQQRAESLMGGDLSAHSEVIQKWTQHFHEVLDGIDHDIKSLFTESVADGEDPMQFVLAKIKLRAFELFRQFDEDNRAALLATVDDLMHADGVVHPNEMKFRNELFRLLTAPIELDEVEIEPLEDGAVVIDSARSVKARDVDHPFLKSFEWDYARDPETFAKQSKTDLELIGKFEGWLEDARGKGAGKLSKIKSFSELAGQESFLDGHVYVVPPSSTQDYEILVLGDLHGCYSCLKAALLQADFFNKVQAWHNDPVNNPKMIAVLLGDYIDRGKFSYNGVLRTVMQLSLAAPGHVFALRGNHEYYVELNGRVLAPVRPAEAMTSLQGIAANEVFGAYMKLFDALPGMLVFDKMLFVHAGIPREDTLAEKYKGLASLNDPEMRFQMLWSDPSEAEAIPLELQKSNARFPFGTHQFKSFMARIGCTTMIRGHEKVNEGFRKVIEDKDVVLLTLFSAGGKNNNDLPEKSNYREVTPMALTIRYKNGISQLTPFVIDYERYNDPQYNSFFKDLEAKG
ncbi:MAG: serine/threonine protein phosphatase [Deltaproteobacteria bacterium]|nr:serine/threonine protein phosphatase [Deltaproteobacteria bacterium]